MRNKWNIIGLIAIGHKIHRLATKDTQSFNTQ